LHLQTIILGSDSNNKKISIRIQFYFNKDPIINRITLEYIYTKNMSLEVLIENVNSLKMMKFSNIMLAALK